MCVGADEQFVDLAGNFEAFSFWYVARGDEMVCSKRQGVCFLTFSPGECSDFTAHFVCELDSEMSKTANTDNAYVICGLEVVSDECIPDCPSTTEEWRCVFGCHVFGDFVDEPGIPDSAGREGSLVEIGLAVLFGGSLAHCDVA